MTDEEIKSLFGIVPYFAEEVIQDYRLEMHIWTFVNIDFDFNKF
jgi:hypothetical protein